MIPTLTIVVPCYNEEEVLPTTAHILSEKIQNLIEMGSIARESQVLFIDDGSSDETWQIIEELSQTSTRFHGVKLSRNVGHQNALLAGLEHVKTDICISIDADLQDDVAAIDAMVDQYRAGFQVVYGVRRNRMTDTVFKRETAKLFYRIMERFGVETVHNHADFRLMSAQALTALLSMREVNIYLRGMVPLIGFPATCVYYDRNARLAGESKYPFRKMIGLAIRGITSFSIMPLRMIAAFGFFVSLIALLLSFWAVIVKLTDDAVPGWASTHLIVLFMGGVQMLALGVVGEYIGCIYLEVKRRPKYFVERVTGR